MATSLLSEWSVQPIGMKGLPYRWKCGIMVGDHEVKFRVWQGSKGYYLTVSFADMHPYNVGTCCTLQESHDTASILAAKEYSNE